MPAGVVCVSSEVERGPSLTGVQLRMWSPFLAAFTLEDLAEGAKVKPFKPGNRLKYYFAIKVGTDLEWNVKFTRLIRLSRWPQWNS